MGEVKRSDSKNGINNLLDDIKGDMNFYKNFNISNFFITYNIIVRLILTISNG